MNETCPYCGKPVTYSNADSAIISPAQPILYSWLVWRYGKHSRFTVHWPCSWKLAVFIIDTERSALPLTNPEE